MKNIAVIGAGSMGTAVSILLAGNGHIVRMWSPFKEEVDMINTYREQKHKLPGAKIPETVTCTVNLQETLEGSDLIILVVPSHTVRQSARNISKYISGSQIIACFSKGIEEDTFLRMSEVISQEIRGARVVAMSGPCHAEELAFGIPSAYVAASLDMEAAELVQDVLMSKTFRVYTNPDVVGVELGGAIKNVIALCAGISDGLGFGDNTKAALMTRGIREMARIGEAMGAQRETFAGLSGIGDLIVTCTSMHSRNRRAGILIGKGKSMEEAVSEVKMVVEGITTAKAAYKLAKKLNISAPIIEQAYRVLFEGKDPRQAVNELMMRDKKCEM
ncbi:MAG TPA: NAD(P)H-dependent glycerol-3-phosphate dehydrogenase [Clostridiaceae bacterium]|nr:NAD(P)H-dependent glycerol-3-phosphate dehydrogenase [Clostridiaceae bacterium]